MKETRRTVRGRPVPPGSDPLWWIRADDGSLVGPALVWLVALYLEEP